MTVVNPKKTGALRDRLFAPRSHRHLANYERVLGTILEFQCAASSKAAGPLAEKRALAEIDRLQPIFNAYQTDSELNRWQQTHGQDIPVSLELAEVLQAAASWTSKTRGAFQPAAEALTCIWKEHERTQTEVTDSALAEVLEQLCEPLWEVDAARGTARRLTRLPVTLNSIAKGYIIDRAAVAASQCEGVREVLVNIGGDLRHIGEKGTIIEIVDPFATADNAAPVAAVRLANGGLATSGNYRRGFRIGGWWHSHLLNPRTGRPVEEVVSASVMAPHALTADVLATVFSILGTDESLRMAESVPETGVLLIERDGTKHSNETWKRREVPLNL